jgi:hypothetical protein
MQIRSVENLEAAAKFVCPNARTDIAVVGPLVCYPRTANSDQEEWYIVVGAARSGSGEFFYDQVKLGLVDEEIPEALLGVVDTAIHITTTGHRTQSQALQERRRVIDGLGKRFAKVYSCESELEMVRRWEQFWPGEKTKRLRYEVEADYSGAQRQNG